MSSETHNTEEGPPCMASSFGERHQHNLAELAVMGLGETGPARMDLGEAGQVI